MIIHGPSGSGKSAFMANTIKLVERLICFDNKKLIYRFIGATPYTSHSREMLLSIFDELSINMRSEADKQIDITERTLNHLDKNETFEEFSDRTYDEIMKIDEKVVLFIDAVDQLTNTDQFNPNVNYAKGYDIADEIIKKYPMNSDIWECYVVLSDLYVDGKYVAKDIHKAINLLKKSKYMENKLYHLAEDIADLYLEQLGDYKNAEKWYKIAYN